jgi:hypothetical protein
MGKLSEDSRNLPINRLLLPGTHDSAAYAMALSVPTLGGAWVERARMLGAVLPPVHSFLGGWALTQGSASVAAQLAMGVRVLDVRVAHLDGTLWCAHTYALVPLSQVLDDIEAFCGSRGGASEGLILCLRADYANRASLSGTRSALLWDALGAHPVRLRLALPSSPPPSLSALAAASTSVLLFHGPDLEPPASLPAFSGEQFVTRVTDWRVGTGRGRVGDHAAAKAREIKLALSAHGKSSAPPSPSTFYLWSDIITPSTSMVVTSGVILALQALLCLGLGGALVARAPRAGCAVALLGALAAGTLAWENPPRSVAALTAATGGGMARRLRASPPGAAYVSVIELDGATPALIAEVVALNFARGKATPLAQ